MGSVRQEFEKLKYEISQGRGEQKIHVTWVEKDQAERIKNNKRVTKFVLETKDPDACSELHAEWERIIKRLHNKSICLDLVIRAWRDALSNQELDKILAAMEAQ
jgi:hypothetical protein